MGQTPLGNTQVLKKKKGVNQVTMYKNQQYLPGLSNDFITCYGRSWLSMALKQLLTVWNHCKNLITGEGYPASTTRFHLPRSTEVRLHHIQVLIRSWIHEQSTSFGYRINALSDAPFLCGIKGLNTGQDSIPSMAPPSRLSSPAVQGFSGADDGCVTILILVLTSELLWSKSPNSPHPTVFWFVAQHSLGACDLDSLQRKWN